MWPGQTTAHEIMHKVCGSFNKSPTMSQTSYLRQAQQNVCNACCQLNYKARPRIDGVLELLNNL